MGDSTAETAAKIAVLETEVRNISTDLREIRQEQKQQYDNIINKMEQLDARLGVIERWRWMLIGGALVLGYIAAQLVPLLK